ncbi:hypothetical protein PLICRDRAFT_57110 [Plicaturopsis crispa FD-325 SS-3]|uniref:Unplaced genomic scaffold PLICRscaffold_15, whole genome shotgun sequence n=1 Tax=Plicaturopsis crispa FD-325 SS-3 TaxID=944288 RepID=A0A0C9SLB0_PLICR|nr:hypothetical protein PLICRDRAFT_57110 [Plicaturopsis crispa FD-325 SS-3]
MSTKRVRMHPMIVRPAFLPGPIRNASGNGGGLLVGYMPIIEDPADPSDRSEASKIVFANFKREVYHKVLGVVFGPMRGPAKHGEAVGCGDMIARVLYPGIPYHSLDGEEACALACCRAALANYPCPRCLVHRDDLDKITQTFPPRTIETMMRTYHDALGASTQTEREEILRNQGLHATENFFWSFPNSCPYSGNSYETLHADDGGKGGKHLIPHVKDVLRDRRLLGHLNQNMRQVPRWPGLKHINNLTTTEYADGQVHLDTLRCLLPCIVQLLPRNSPLVHCIRAYAQFRIMISLRCITEAQIERLRGYIADYEKWCKEVTKTTHKSFKFPKQHHTPHVLEDLVEKGATYNYSARPGEGFHQESHDAYEQTNGKNVDPQVTRIEENKEVMAAIRMAVDASDKASGTRRAENTTDEPRDSPADDDGADDPGGIDRRQHWALGASDPFTDAQSLEISQRANSAFQKFDPKLRTFLQTNIPDDAVGTGPIKIRPYKCLYLKYQSLEDWSEARDIMRCSSRFHQRERRDCVLVNTEGSDLTCARLCGLFACYLPSGRTCDVALVQYFKSTKWRPRTEWAGCRVYEEKAISRTEFVMLRFLVRGVHMIPAFDSLKPPIHYLNDTVDGDIFLRAGN